MAYSTIKKKKCKNELCEKYPKIGYNGFCGVKCMPEEMQQDPKYKILYQVGQFCRHLFCCAGQH